MRTMAPSKGIMKLDYPSAGERRPLLHPITSGDSDDGYANRTSQDTSYAGSFFEQVAEGIQEREKAKLSRQLARYFGFFWAVLNCLCAGSITAYSLYGPLFQTRLRYSQYRVNIISIVAELGMYLPVPLFGLMCDRYGPGRSSFFSGTLFGAGYLLAALTYRSGPPPSVGGDGWPFGVMVLAFALVGMGTSCMYLCAVTTCAKNFGRGAHKGIALAIPIAAFGLSGMWQSQVGSRLLAERLPDGSRGDVDVFRYFLFLAGTCGAVGALGALFLRIIDEGDMIDEAVDDLERSGILGERSEFFREAAQIHGYGTVATPNMSESTFSFLNREAEVLAARKAEEAAKKTWLLNAETRRFLGDRTMWWLTAGFFLITGPGEAFINNLGTIIGTLYPPGTPPDRVPTTPATHVSIVAITSTIARLLTGTLTDLLAPPAPRHKFRPDTPPTPSSAPAAPPKRRLTLSRISFLLAFSLLLSGGQVLLASGAAQDRAHPAFALVSAAIGAGYGAVFSLVPIVVSVVWGVENFGTNWGLVATAPAFGAAVWGGVYAAVYQRAANAREWAGAGGDVEQCYGTACYAPTFWGMAVSVWVACGLWVWAWRGPGGWKQRGVAV